jgi:MtN3 and saliva related transmembrane protein
VITVVGLLAGALTTGAWLPQIWRTWRTRSAGDLSWHYLAATAAGIATWLLYGVLSRDVAVIVTNVAACTLLSVLLLAKARAGRNVPAVVDLVAEMEPAA